MDILKRLRMGLVGILYGVGLGYLAFLCAGFGHGTYIPLVLSSAPLVLAGVATALFGTPVLWALLGILAVESHRSPYNWVFLIATLAHYVTGIIIVVTTDFGDWGYVHRTWEAIPVVMLGWVAAYALGHAGIWYGYVRVRRTEL